MKLSPWRGEGDASYGYCFVEEEGAERIKQREGCPNPAGQSEQGTCFSLYFYNSKQMQYNILLSYLFKTTTHRGAYLR